MSLNYLATRFTCSLAVEHDGAPLRRPPGLRLRRSLRQARPRRHAHRVGLGDLDRRDRVRAAPDIVAGGSKFCGDCPLKLPLKKDEQPPQRALDVGPLPSRLYIECTAACNISCNQACCAPETGITRTRQAGMLDYDLFTRVVDEAGPSVGRIDFFNYGEAFLHKRALDMVEYIKSRYPHVYLYTSTNGLALTEDGARRLARSGHRRGDVLDRRRPRRELRAVPPARRLRQGDPFASRSFSDRLGEIAALPCPVAPSMRT